MPLEREALQQYRLLPELESATKTYGLSHDALTLTSLTEKLAD
jgi:hypothetical protein